MIVKRASRATLVAAILLSGLGFLLVTPTPASAAPGFVPTGSQTFTGLGGSLQVGAGAVPVNVPTYHPDRPTQCNDGVDNEVGSRYQNFPNAYSTRNITDGNVSSGSAILTSATAAFTAADVGRTVEDSGNVLLPAGTTILSLNSGTSVNLSQNATGTSAAGAFTIRDSIINAPDNAIDNGSDAQCTSTADDDEAMTFTGTGGGFQNTAVCDNQTNFPANPQPRKNWSIPATVTAGSPETVSITPSAVTVPDNVLLQGTTQLAGLQLQILQSVKPLAPNAIPPHGNNGDPCARTFTDGGTTSGSATVTSTAQAQFQGAGFQSDIGAFISGPGIPPNTTVTARASATSITISQNATATASGVTMTLGGHGGTNGSTTIGSNVFTATGFSALDTGALIWAAGVPTGTTIVSVTSGTQVVMSQNATATASGVAFTAAANPYKSACSGGATWTGQSASDGSGSLDICVFVELNLHEISNPDTIAPNDVICRTDAFPIHLTTETDGSLTGVRYDTTKKTTTMVATNFTIPLTTAAAGGSLGQLVCDGVNSQVGFPSGPANNQLTMVTSTATGPWPPVAAITSPTTINVNEGDVVTLGGDFANSYDPGSRTLTEVGWTRTGGTASAPVAFGGTTTNKTFVAQDAPSGGNTHTFNYCVSAPLLVSSTSNDPANTSPEQGCKSVTVNVANVAPTASAGANRTVDGGVATSLTGTSVDPGDRDVPGERGYCWTQTGGTSVGLPACTGSPANNRPSSGGKFTSLGFTPANANDTLTFQLQVCDKDGGCSSTSSTTVTTKATTAGQISGSVNVCTPGCSPAGAGAVTVKLYKDGVGQLASMTTAAGGGYCFGPCSGGAALSGGGYRVGFSSGSTSVLGEYWNDAKWATEGDAITAPSAIVNADVFTLGQGKTISGTVTQTAGGPAPDGTAVRLYDESGFVGNTVTGGGTGAYSFTLLQPKSTYKVDFARGSATLAETWNGGAFSAPNAPTIDVTSGNATVNIALNDKGIATNGQGNINGNVNNGDGGQAGIQVRAYDATTGKWIASVTTDAGGNYSFAGANFGTNVNGLAPGTYKVWFWNVNQAGPSVGQFYCSTWFGGDIKGGQYQGSGKLVTNPVVVTANAGTLVNVVLTSGDSTTCPK